jgi:hypothetical protein
MRGCQPRKKEESELLIKLAKRTFLLSTMTYMDPIPGSKWKQKNARKTALFNVHHNGSRAFV